MKFTWLSQAGLLIEFDCGATVISDPYLSDYVEKFEPWNKRRMPVDPAYLAFEPDFLLFTHDHIDHYDPDTAPIYLSHEKPMTVLCPESVFRKIDKSHRQHNVVLMRRHSEWNEKGLWIRAVMADHSEPFALGYLITDVTTDETVWITGDTLYNREILEDVSEESIKITFVPVNGVGNNVNFFDACRLVDESGTEYAVPYHVGLFDSHSPDEFEFGTAVTLTPILYEPVEIPKE